MNIFVGNLSFEVKEIDLERAFMAFGVVTSAAIVMEKKGKKSRGFGFVEMPDEQEAQAAIAQLQGKEILGRPINVTAAVSKGPKSEPAGKANNSRHDPSFVRTGKYREGRRSLSYLKKRTEAGITAPVPEKRYKSNPMRWLKKPRTPARFERPEGELKPWQRVQTESNPWKKPLAKSGAWKKPQGEVKPWQKSRGESKPWVRPGSSEVKPWEKSRSESKPWVKAGSSEVKPWEKNRSESKSWIKSANSEAKPWKKTESSGAARPPWKKSASAAKPWRKSSADRQQTGFKKPRRFSK